MDVEIPQIAIQAEQISEDVIILSLMVTTSGTQAKYFLCTSEQNYQQIAKTIHDGICRAGAEARQAKSGLIVVKDLPDGLKNGGRSVRNAKA